MSYTKGLARAIRETMENVMNEMFSKAYSQWRDDSLMEELRKSHPNRLKVEEILAHIMEQDDLPLDNIWRVELMENHKIMLTDFTMPSSSPILNKTIPISEAPDFIRNGLAVLQIAQDETQVEGIGKRISDSIYYIVERNDGINAREES